MPYVFCLGSIRTPPGEAAVGAGVGRIEGHLNFAPSETLGTIKAAIEGAIEVAQSEDRWLREHPPVLAAPADGAPQR